MRAYNLSVSGSLDVSGNITGSNISASGTVYADSFSSPTSGESGVISFADDLSITGDVTASGHISASSTSTGSFGRVEASTVEGTFGSTSEHHLVRLLWTKQVQQLVELLLQWQQQVNRLWTRQELQ